MLKLLVTRLTGPAGGGGGAGRPPTRKLCLADEGGLRE
jgi:hypothetical protein